MHAIIRLKVLFDHCHDLIGKLVLDFDTGFVLFFRLIIPTLSFILASLGEIGLSSPFALSVGIGLEGTSFSIHYQEDLGDLKRLEEFSAS